MIISLYCYMHIHVYTNVVDTVVGKINFLLTLMIGREA